MKGGTGISRQPHDEPMETLTGIGTFIRGSTSVIARSMRASACQRRGDQRRGNSREQRHLQPLQL